MKRILIGVVLVAVLVYALVAYARPARLPSVQTLDDMDYASTSHAYQNASQLVGSIVNSTVVAAPAAGLNRYLKTASLCASVASGTTTQDIQCQILNGPAGFGNLVVVYPGTCAVLNFDGRGMQLAGMKTSGGVAQDGTIDLQMLGTTPGGVRCSAAVIYADELP